MKGLIKTVRVLGALLVCILLTGAFVDGKRDMAEREAQYEIYSGENSSGEYAGNQAKATDAYTAFFQYYYKQQCESCLKAGGYTVNGVSSRFIPDFYGGAYVNKFGNLVIEVVDTYNTPDFYQSAVYKEILAATGAEAEDIVIRFVATSYRDLMDEMENMKEYAASEDTIDFLGFGIDDYNNRIEIDLPAR